MFGSSRTGRNARTVNGRSTKPLTSGRAASDLVRCDALEPRLVLSNAVFHIASPQTEGELAGPVSPVSLLEWEGSDFKVATGSWLISFNDKIGGGSAADLAARQVATAMGVAVKSTFAVGRYCVEFTTTGKVTKDMIARVMDAMPNIKSIEPDRMYDKSLVPNDERYTEQYAHDNTGTFLGSLGKLDADMDTPEAWETTIGTRDQVVAVIDTGVQITHPDLADNIFVNTNEIAGNGVDDDNNGFIDDVHGWDFWDNENDPDDYEGHGTHVSGIIGAVGNNGIGVAGVNWAVSILPVRVLGPFGGTLASVVAGIDYVTMLRESGVPIAAANASYGAPGSRLYEDLPQGFDAEKDAIERFINQGGTFVAAAGNNSNDNDAAGSTFFPSSYKIPGLISVAATDWDDRLAGFSNYGAETVDLGAPGDLILSTVPTDSYAYFSGTSMAAPQVSGAVALMRSIKPFASAVEIRQTLLDSVDPLADLQGKTVSGGRLNIARAIEIIGITGPVLKTLLPGPVTGQVDPSTNTPLKTITMRFNRPIDATKLDATVFELRRDGTDGNFDTGDDGLITIASVSVSESDPKQVTLTLNLNNQPAQRLPLDHYRLTIFDSVGAKGLLDTDGNFLNGNSVSGNDEEYFFEVVPVSGTYEINDTLATATAVTFSASGTARFTGVTIGDGTQSALDVDIFRLDLARGGQITAEITAKRLSTGSNLDSYLRLFNANGQELARNDQFYGQDSYIDYYVSTGGTYYVAVSGFGNDRYDPNAAGSGNSQSTGLYTLSLTASLNTDDLVTAESDFDAPVPIPTTGTQGVIESYLSVSDARQIIDANVQIRVRHEFVSDLKISVISPSGTQVVLFNRRGADGDQGITPTLFDDEAPQHISTGSSPFAGAFQPEQALGAFDGQSATGTWTLRIEDLSGANAGFLDGWRVEFRVENDVFGDFEPNDTIPNAKDLAQISNNGAGSTTVSAFLGDGGFGLLDRDFFKFSVNAGASLTAQTLTSTDSALRLFNAQGQQLVLASDAVSDSARIENFVFNDAGTFYLAVSSAANKEYDPFNAVSGASASETGNYTLEVNVTDGVSDGSLILSGEDLSVGLGTDGIFYSTASGGRGIKFGNTEFLFSTAAPVDLPGSFFGAASDGSVFLNSRQPEIPQHTVQLPFSLTDQSDYYNARGVGKALFNGGLRIERDISMSKTENYIAVDMTFTNEGTKTIGNLSWMEGFNPEMGRNLNPSTSDTANDIAGSMATASYSNNDYLSGLTVGLAAPASDTRATAMVVAPTIVESLRDPTQLQDITPVDPDGTRTDSYLALVYDLGQLTVGQTVTVRYFMFFGINPTAVNEMYAAVNNGTGAGHLTADPAAPANETLADGSDVPQLPYRYYFPEGFATPNTNTFIPILNSNDQAARVVVIAHYESGVRDQVIADFGGDNSVKANSRSGVTITSPQLFAAGEQLVRAYEGYAVEVRSDRPLATTFSHYDTNLTTTAASIGESFTTRVSNTWTFSQISNGGTARDFLIYYNTSETTSKVEFTFYPEDGGPTRTYTQTVAGHRRLGLDIDALTDDELPRGANGEEIHYGVKIVSQTPIVAVLSHYDTANHTAEGLNGLPNLGSRVGATSEGDLGRDATSERFAILNATEQAAEVSLVFLFTSGSSYRAVVNVDAQSQKVVDVGTLDGFPIGEEYSMQYTSTGSVTVSLIADAFGDQLFSGLSDRAYRFWGFGEGFKPRDGNPLVSETLRLYNPSATDTIAEVILRYDANLGTESLRVIVPARKAFAINIHDLVTGSRRNTEVWYGLSVKSASPIIASMTHADAYFPGAFSTLGTPMGEGVGL